MRGDELKSRLEAAFLSRKSVVAPAPWIEGRSAEQLRALIQLVCLDGDITVADLHVIASRHAVERDVSFTLKVTVAGLDCRLWRLDWRPRSEHVNRHPRTPRRLRGVRSLRGVHDFGPNIGLGIQDMQTENLPICEPLEPEPSSFTAAFSLVCERLIITSKVKMEEPPWSPRLLRCQPPVLALWRAA